MFPAAETAKRREVIVRDLKFGKRSRKRFAIVLRIRTRSRHGPDVGDKRDIRLLQQVHEFRERPRRMADGKDRKIHVALSRSLDYIGAHRLRNRRPADVDANVCDSAMIGALSIR